MTLATSLGCLSVKPEARLALRLCGAVQSVRGMELTAVGLARAAAIGGQVLVAGRIRGEIVFVSENSALIVPFGSWEGISSGDEVLLLSAAPAIRPDANWLGRVVDAFGDPLDERTLVPGGLDYPLRATPPDAFARREVGAKMQSGIKAIDIFAPICRGQRIGVFAGSGVGKSTLMAMLARNSAVDVVVIGLIGERGREVQSFIRRDLGPEGMARSILVVATSDQPALNRRQAAWTATAIAEYFRDQGLHVLLMLDSVTRFAMAQREIGLSAGEPPTSRGYTPTVFSELPRLLERSGPGAEVQSLPNMPKPGDITAVYTVLVDGDDSNEPISDTVRGILDGHVVLDRAIAERGRYPAINVLKSISRMLPYCHNEAENLLLNTARRGLARYSEMEELIRLGAYQAGSDPELDRAIQLVAKEDQILAQTPHDKLPSEVSFANLYGILLDCGFDLPRA